LIVMFASGCASAAPPPAKNSAAAASGRGAPAAAPAPAAEQLPGDNAPTTLVKDLESAILAGVDDRHVYWISRKRDADGNDEGPPHLGAGRLMRVLKTGGPAETVLDATILAPGCGFVADDRRVYFVEEDAESLGPNFAGAIVAVDRRAPHKLVRLADRRVGACHLVAAGGRLFWEEQGDAESDHGTARVVSAKMDGGDLRVLWESPHPQAPRGLLVDGSRLVVALTNPEPPAMLGGLAGLGGLGSSGRSGKRPKPGVDGDKSAITILSLATQGEPPRPFPALPVADTRDVGLAGLDGSDLWVCTRQGLFRVPRDGSGSPRLGGKTCPATTRVWNGWGVFPEYLTQEGALFARRLTDNAPSVEVFAHVAPFATMDVQDHDAFYACVLTDTHKRDRCDLMRATTAVFAAREKQAAASEKASRDELAGPFRTPGDDRGSPGEWADYQPGLLTTKEVYDSLRDRGSECLGLAIGQQVAGVPKLVTRLFIDPSGNVRDIAAVHDTYANDTFRACLLPALRGAHFPARSDGAHRRIDYVFVQDTTLPQDPKPNPDVAARIVKVVQGQSTKLRACGLTAGAHDGDGADAIELTLFVDPSGKVKNAAVSSTRPIADAAVSCAVRLLTRQSTSAFPDAPAARVVVPLRQETGVKRRTEPGGATSPGREARGGRILHVFN
jgi:hypothetical protein